MMTSHSNPAVLTHPLGAKIARALSDQADGLPHHVTERLRAARVRAVANRKITSPVTAPAVHAQNGAAVLHGGPGPLGFWGRLGSLLPMIVLLAGWVIISQLQSEHLTSELVDVDSALLVDDLPPAAYTDPGFVQFLKNSREPN